MSAPWEGRLTGLQATAHVERLRLAEGRANERRIGNALSLLVPWSNHSGGVLRRQKVNVFDGEPMTASEREDALLDLVSFAAPWQPASRLSTLAAPRVVRSGAAAAEQRWVQQARPLTVVEDGGSARFGETASTRIGREVHAGEAARRRESGMFDVVNAPITDMAGAPILVPKRVDLWTGQPQPGTPLQTANPDAASYQRALIVDDKPLGRPLAKDRQEIIRFIEAYRQREGRLPETIGIQRYDPRTGQPVRTDLHTPEDFLPRNN